MQDKLSSKTELRRCGTKSLEPNCNSTGRKAQKKWLQKTARTRAPATDNM